MRPFAWLRQTLTGFLCPLPAVTSLWAPGLHSISLLIRLTGSGIRFFNLFSCFAGSYAILSILFFSHAKPFSHTCENVRLFARWSSFVSRFCIHAGLLAALIFAVGSESHEPLRISRHRTPFHIHIVNLACCRQIAASRGQVQRRSIPVVLSSIVLVFH